MRFHIFIKEGFLKILMKIPPSFFNSATNDSSCVLLVRNISVILLLAEFFSIFCIILKSATYRV